MLGTIGSIGQGKVEWRNINKGQFKGTKGVWLKKGEEQSPDGNGKASNNTKGLKRIAVYSVEQFRII